LEALLREADEGFREQLIVFGREVPGPSVQKVVREWLARKDHHEDLGKDALFSGASSA